MIVLAVGAHPDDIELAAGGTLAKHAANGDDIHCLVMTRGEGGNADVVTRTKEAVAASYFLPYASLKFGGVPALQLTGIYQTHIDIIEECINEVKPDRIYAHSADDRHQHHEIVARCTEVAGRHAQQYLTFELPSTRNFQPNWFVDITDHIDAKLKLIAYFESQQEKPYMVHETIKGRALDWAVRANMRDPNLHTRAEAFCLERHID